MRRALGPILVAFLALEHATASGDPLCESHCSRSFSPNKGQEYLWGTSRACRLGCRLRKLDSLLQSEDNSTCTDSCTEAFFSGPSQRACLKGCDIPVNDTSGTESEMQSMPASANVDSLLELFLAPFLTSGLPLSRDEYPHEIHVVDITIVTVDDLYNPNGSIQKIMVLEGTIPIAQEDLDSGAGPVDVVSTTPTASGDWVSDARLMQFLMLMQLLLVVAISLLTVSICCHLQRKPRDGKDVAEILRIAEGSRRLHRLQDNNIGEGFAIGQLYKPPLLPTYQEALEQSQLVVRVAVSDKPKIVEGILTVVPDKQQLQQPPSNSADTND